MEIEGQSEKSGGSGWLRGASKALPITLGYVPIGFAYGVLAQKAGLSAFNTLAMSIFVYAGSSQLIAVGLRLAALQIAFGRHRASIHDAQIGGLMILDLAVAQAHEPFTDVLRLVLVDLAAKGDGPEEP